MTSRNHTQHIQNIKKHRDHGGGAAHHSSAKDSMYPHNNLMHGQPRGEVVQGNRSKKYSSIA